MGLVFLVLGAVLMVAMLLPGEGRLTDYVRNLVVPFFGAARYLLPMALLVAGWYLEWGPGRHPEAPWGRTLAGIGLAYIAFLGLVQAVAGSGGRIGTFLYGALQPLLTAPGAFVVLLALTVAGLLIAFDQPLHALLSPAARAARAAGASLQARSAAPETGASASVRPAAQPRLGSGPASADDAPNGGGRRGHAPRMASGDAPGQTGLFGTDGAHSPIATSAAPPISATIAPQRVPGGNGPGASGTSLAAGARPATAEPRPLDRDGDGVIEAGDAPPTRGGMDWVLPGLDLLEMDRVPLPGDGASREAIHRHNESRIIEKLNSFGIEASIVGRNAGPVVTQYEVQPAPHIKVSRIEALSDDLAMALAARSIRIEAPIPGKSAVGIEIPNAEFNVVSLRRIFDEVDFAASGSRLMFALGRDVAGKATAVDLARMPHLLIAGATGSGKSVMVNALITSLLCKAGPRPRSA